ncbi:MAG: hypothetical protein Kow0063_31300 [Anaerolineae bacterium]
MLPLSSFHIDNLGETIKDVFLQRDNLDPFRLNAEISLLLAVWVHVRWMRNANQRQFLRWFFLAFYFVALAYYLYEGVMLSLYQVEPVFYNHYLLLVDGLPFVGQHLKVPLGFYPVAAVILGGGLWLIATLARTMIDGISGERLSRRSKLGLTLIALLVIAATFKYQTTLASPRMVISSLTCKLQQNIEDSIEAYRNILALNNGAPRRPYNYSGYDLLEKPNIYLIFVESYGSVLYKRADYREAYTALLSQLQRQLRESGWHAVSTLSEAPTWGGGSWMSYTSALFGTRIDTHPQFLSLLDKYQDIPYPDLGHYLKTQGYEYVRVSSLSDELGEEEWLRYKKFYGVDRWLRYRDLGYHGAHFGWGPAPPDQYVLNFAYETIIHTSEQPVFFFFITQNSHYPWVPLPEVVDDWRTLNQETAEEPVALPEPILHEVRRSNYFKSIEYELRFLIDFIAEKGDDRSIFVLIGDHQPQRVSRHNDGFETPVHIISRDRGLTDAFLEYGFVRGLAVHDIVPAMRHEGFYSMFVRALLARYGQGLKPLPDYLPDGITLKDNASTNGS